MLISLVVAASTDNAIGGNNTLLWRLPNDMKFFKNLTWGMPVIMGRKTFVSLAGKPLPGRTNIVITRDANSISSQPGLLVCGSLEEALQRARSTDCREAFVIGGGDIYRQAIPMADKIYLTRVYGEFKDADVFFPAINTEDFQLIDCIEFAADDKHHFSYAFETWVRKQHAETNA
jgi:dihydrofolate reductase